MNQLDIYLGRSHGDLANEVKLVHVNELVKGSFLITEFCNGEVKYYTQKEGQEPVLNNALAYSDDNSLHPSLAEYIYQSAINKKVSTNS